MSTDLNDLATFVRVAELGTFSAAALAEGVPKSTISRRVARLENNLGVELLRRSSRSFRLTAEGRSLHVRAVGALRELEDSTNALLKQPREPSGRLVFSAPTGLGSAPIVVDLLAEYRERYSQVDIEVRLQDRFVDLVAEGVDIGLRVHSKTIPGDGALITLNIGSIKGGFYAAPGYLEKNGIPKTPKDLVCHDLVVRSSFVGRPLILQNQEGTQESVDLVRTAFICNSTYMIGAMLERGAGVGLLTKFVAETAVEQARLIRLLPEWWVQDRRLSMVWPSSRHLASRVRAFVELARQRLVNSRLVYSGDDAKAYQEKQVKQAIEEVQE